MNGQLLGTTDVKRYTGVMVSSSIIPMAQCTL